MNKNSLIDLYLEYGKLNLTEHQAASGSLPVQVFSSYIKGSGSSNNLLSDIGFSRDSLSLILEIIDPLLILLPVLLSVAFMTIIERKQLAAHQRRIGPNTVGFYGILQPFADALKLILKENVIPSQSNKIIFYLAPVFSLIFSLLGWAIIPFGPGYTIFDFSLGILYTLALSSLGVYGILFAGWSANSKYAFLGSLRSTAAMISYELILSSVILIILILTISFNLTSIVEFQESTWLILPLFPVFVLYFISILAETSRTPFDLQEAESELVGGFFTEHSSVPFVFFFLSEYSSIVLFSTLTSVLFLGGYNLPNLNFFEGMIDTIVSTQFLSSFTFGFSSKDISLYFSEYPNTINSFNMFISSLYSTFAKLAISINWGIVLGIKTCFICSLFVGARALLARYRYSDLIKLCWLGLLPLVIALTVLYPAILTQDFIIFNLV